MTVLVIAEHDNASIKPATLNTVTAAAQCGGDVHVLIAGHNAGEAAKAAAAPAVEPRPEVAVEQQALHKRSRLPRGDDARGQGHERDHGEPPSGERTPPARGQELP